MKSFLNHIVEESQFEIYISDRETFKFLYANKKAISNLGYSREELFSMTPLDMLPNESEEQMKEILSPLFDENAAEIVFGNFLMRKDGTSYPVDVHIQLTEYDGRKAYVASIVDATEKLHLNEQLHLVIQGASLGYWDWNMEAGVFYFRRRNINVSSECL